MRRFQTPATAGRFCRGHALIRNLARSFSDQVSGTSPRLRLVTAWTVLAATL